MPRFTSMKPVLCSLVIFVLVASSGFLNYQNSRMSYHAAAGRFVATNNTCHEGKKQLNSKKRKPIVVIHAGPHKTSSTSLQKLLMEQSQNGRLGKDGYETLGQTKFTGCPRPTPQFPPSSHKNHATLTFALQEGMCAPMSNKSATPLPLQQLSDLLSSAFARNKSVILSAEGFAKPAVNLTILNEHIYAEGENVQTPVVLYYRRLLDWLPSKYFQLHRFKDDKDPIASFVEWLTPETLSDTMKTYTWQVKERFEEHGFPNVQILSMHNNSTSSPKPDLPVQFVCDYVPNADHTCNALLDPKNPNQIVHKNRATSLEYRRILAQAHKAGLIQQRATAKNPKALRLLEERLAAKPQSFKHKYRVCLSEALKEHLLELSLAYEMKMVCGSLDCECMNELQSNQDEIQEQRRTEFQALLGSSDKLCSWSVELLLQDEEWKAFFRSLEVQ